MDNFLSFVGPMLKQLAFSFIFFWIGWAVIKFLTLGRYPRTINPKRADCADYQLVAVSGLLSLVGIIIFLTYLRN
jgi:hypothetical protein